ncbi:uncharacterized protein EI97DRAFT_441381 [Westerdykella ornata]|uniref:Mid2 domain-containing protein n=1 Tax=Westerdykella ornata TaxID=318751 RepID=A0A6A6JMG5_WESOR|nr:uncharacterized protein EI97DRAFT_441381 [Westerdykella ornata]KAF2277313.1 hypothetical protein EI97DRAFT_441381 [Westerdykella ornata]
MRPLNGASPALALSVAIVLLPAAIAKPYPVHIGDYRQLHNESLVDKRQQDCALWCGWNGFLCCPSGTKCGTNAKNEAICDPISGNGGDNSGSWQFFTSTWIETGTVTRTSVYSSFVGAPTANSCGGARVPCGGGCCDSGYWCSNEDTQECRLIGGSSSPGIAPLPPATGTPTGTVPFKTPIPTGSGTAIPQQGGGGLSGGAIAGIVIGVIAGVLLLLFLCLFCCAKALFDSIMAIFGFGKKRRHTHEETYIEERHRHSHSGSAAGGRRWYGQAARPARPPPKKGGGFGNALGIGAALGGLALALGLKRRHDRKHDDKSTTISGSSAYYSDYTSTNDGMNGTGLLNTTKSDFEEKFNESYRFPHVCMN